MNGVLRIHNQARSSEVEYRDRSACLHEVGAPLPGRAGNDPAIGPRAACRGVPVHPPLLARILYADLTLRFHATVGRIEAELVYGLP